MKIVFATYSPARRKLAKVAGINARFIFEEVKERKTGLPPARLVQHNALLKAKSAARKLNKGLIVAFDTLVFFKGRAIGKPRGARHAKTMINALQGNWNDVYSGVAVIDAKTMKTEVGFEKTRVRLAKASKQEIEEIVRQGKVLKRAGAYARELVEVCDGSFANVVGIPPFKLKQLLEKFGVKIDAKRMEDASWGALD